MSVLGNRVVRTEDPGLLTGATPFVSDIADPLLEGAVHVTYVRSAMAHARITGVDSSEALQAPGVIGVFTAGDLGLTPQPSPFSPPFMTCPLATDVVRYVGEPIAAVVTERGVGGTVIAEVAALFGPVEQQEIPPALTEWFSAAIGLPSNRLEGAHG